jgi:hypothetical protein
MLVGLFVRIRGKRNTYKVWTGIREGKKPFRRRRRRWENDVMDRRHVEWEGVGGFIWLWVCAIGGIFGFHKMGGIC